MTELPRIDAAPAEDDTDRRVFFGNVAFTTQEQDLKEAFSKAGEIEKIHIVVRGKRSLGYGFITFTTKEAAAKAVATLDKSDIAGRQVNVENAKPPKPRQPRREKATPEAAPASMDGVVTQDGEATPKPKSKSKRAKRKGPRKARIDAETEEAGDAPTAPAASDAPAATTTPAPERKKRVPRPRRGPPSGPPSKTQVYASNLAFAVDSDKLKAVFEGFTVVSAKVITTKYGRGAGRSKGFGFVEFETEKDQLAAIEKYNGTELEGRPVNLKVALQEERTTAAAKEDSEKPAESTVAPVVPTASATEAPATV